MLASVAARSKNENRWPIPPLASRPYDVTFIGKLEYEAKAEVSGVTLHRRALGPTEGAAAQLGAGCPAVPRRVRAFPSSDT